LAYALKAYLSISKFHLKLCAGFTAFSFSAFTNQTNLANILLEIKTLSIAGKHFCLKIFLVYKTLGNIERKPLLAFNALCVTIESLFIHSAIVYMVFKNPSFY